MARLMATSAFLCLLAISAASDAACSAGDEACIERLEDVETEALNVELLQVGSGSLSKAAVAAPAAEALAAPPFTGVAAGQLIEGNITMGAEGERYQCGIIYCGPGAICCRSHNGLASVCCGQGAFCHQDPQGVVVLCMR
mmetsp:Transcript_115646/g.247153  ORF Transcript_115646/g.247153 Transcript_115646/m.247153 type:complete len:140 (-) Transcript_115646:49-468(-)